MHGLKRIIQQNLTILALKETNHEKGAFWYIDNHITSYTDDNIVSSENTLYMPENLAFNHKLIRNKYHPVKGCKPYNYYPRGSVDIDNKNRSVIYANPHIDDNALNQVIYVFELGDNYRVVYDVSKHYLCHLDINWHLDN